MISRVSRLVVAEFIKLLTPFFFTLVGLVAVGTYVGGTLGPHLAGPETVWRPYHAIDVFANGFAWGLRIAGFALVILSSMTFASEFDRGTIKNLLTRPITRTDLFTAKCATVLILGMGLFLFTLYSGLAIAFARGDLGDVWTPDQYVIMRPYELLAATTRKAVLMSFFPFLAAGFLGILVSNWTESSGYSVALGLMFFLFGGLITDMLPIAWQRKSFFYFIPYVLGKLRLYAEGGTEHWEESLETQLLYLKVPLASILAFLPGAYVIFRRRNITA
ncbi:MAG TPA: ABC transporter permease [Planctomycetota bacterium]|nr:ABC transporter permease [Planctomycetota bacterium]